jgi:hypothetical protein
MVDAGGKKEDDDTVLFIGTRIVIPTYFLNRHLSYKSSSLCHEPRKKAKCIDSNYEVLGPSVIRWVE